MNQFKQRLNRKDRQFGLFCVLMSAEIADALTDSNFDFLVFDLEHTPITLPMLHSQLLALEGTKTGAVVRVASSDPTVLKPVLDLGATTLMLPNVRNESEAAAAVKAIRFPPAGIRGIGASVRVTRYGRRTEYYGSSNDDTCLLLQIESMEGIRNIEAICAVDGVDGVFFGPADLAADIGHIGKPTHPAVIESIVGGIRRVRGSGMPAGVLAPESLALQYVSEGATFICLGSDVGLLTSAADSLARRCREVTATPGISQC